MQKEEVTVSLFATDTILYTEIPMEITNKKAIELVSKLSKDMGYKINTNNQFYFYILAAKNVMEG